MNKQAQTYSAGQDLLSSVLCLGCVLLMLATHSTTPDCWLSGKHTHLWCGSARLDILIRPICHRHVIGTQPACGDSTQTAKSQFIVMCVAGLSEHYGCQYYGSRITEQITVLL